MPRVTRAEFDQLPLLYKSGDPMDQSGLEIGDIIIHNDSKQWTAYKDSGPLASFHASMMVDKIFRIHALPGKGVEIDLVGGMGDMAIVFRLGPALLNPYAQQAADYAKKMEGVAYSKGRAIAMPFASRDFDKSARKRLDKYATAAYDYRPKHVVCSELIVLAYQFAFGQGHQSFIQLDAKHTTPGNLESYLLNNATNWTLAGRIRGAKIQ